MADPNPYAPPQSPVADAPPAVAGPKGIGGWLLLPVIGMFVFPVRCLISLATEYLPIFEKGMWAALTTPGSKAYHPLWGPLLAYEIFFNLAFLVFDLVLLYLLFAKSYRFPKLYIAFAVLNLVFVVSDAIVGYQIPAVVAQGMDTMAKEIGRSFMMVVIWVPYLMVSKRVKNTFVRTQS
jgi:Protein of unknown function (DUF2569)